MPLGKKYFITNLKWILFLWTYLCSRSLATSTCQDSNGNNPADWAILYKAPAQRNGAAGNWADSPAEVTANNGHSFAKALEHVIGADANNKFISYNNDPPDVPKVKTKSNSKGVLMMDITGTDAAAWIVHTVPGFPKARTGYLFPPAEVQKGHLLICLTIKEDQIDTIEKPNKRASNGVFCKQHQNAKMQGEVVMQTAPAQSNGKVLVEGAAANWAGSPVAVTADNGHSFAKALEHVIAVNANNKFISYNNLPPDVPKVKTKSNSKGVLMMDTTNADAAAWIVHTVPGFPKARTGYLFPPAEIQKGHLLICLTIKEDQIDTIALTLRFATPLIYYNDIPDTEMNSRPNLKKLVSGESRILPPLAVTKDTATAAAVGLKVTIYSKEIYRKILLKKLKSTVKVWTARDNKLK
ncbi:Plancitoxin-1, partial [Trichinella sp. T6]